MLYSWIRASVAGLAGGLAWRCGLLFIFGAAQGMLADPARQSAKMLAVFSLAPPMPRMYEAPWLIWAGLLSIGILWGWVYVWVAVSWPLPWWRRGLRFGLMSWVLMVPWFEFYLPWNVLREPLALVGLEMLCWAGVMLMVGVTIAGVEAALRYSLLRS
jgi:hypothetical protein